jgi:hypothetical protein
MVWPGSALSVVRIVKRLAFSVRIEYFLSTQSTPGVQTGIFSNIQGGTLTMKNRWGVAALTAVVLLVMLTACAKAPREASDKAESGKRLSIKGTILFVLIDRGIEKSFTDMQVKNRDQVGDFMEQDLPAVLKKSGFNARLISKRSEYQGAAGSYLLTVKITNYNPGSQAARMLVGYGAGAASMDTHYELYGVDAKPLLSDNQSVGSGRDWRNVIRKINEQTTKAVAKKVSAL